MSALEPSWRSEEISVDRFGCRLASDSWCLCGEFQNTKGRDSHLSMYVVTCSKTCSQLCRECMCESVTACACDGLVWNGLAYIVHHAKAPTSGICNDLHQVVLCTGNLKLYITVSVSPACHAHFHPNGSSYKTLLLYWLVLISSVYLVQKWLWIRTDSMHVNECCENLCTIVDEACLLITQCCTAMIQVFSLYVSFLSSTRNQKYNWITAVVVVLL